MRFFDVREHLRSSLWFIPTLCVLAVVPISVLLGELDQTDAETHLFDAGPESARGVLSTIASSMITFTGLVFTITIVVLQLASQQFSPRVLRTFLRDRHSQLALGVFVATFTYALIVLRTVRSDEVDGGPFVPEWSTAFALLLVLFSLALFVDYIHHISQSIRVGNITASIGSETRAAIADIYDHEHAAERLPLPSDATIKPIAAPKRGVVTGLDRDGLASLAEASGTVVEVVPAIGDYVPEGSDLLRVYGENLPPERELTDLVSLGSERTMQQDPAFGFRQLVDIAQRGLSPGVNDPTTAIQCLDEMHDLLRKLATRPFPAGQRVDRSGRLRVVFPVTTWEDYVSLAFDEIRHYGRESLQVHRRMRSIMRDLLSVVSFERRPPLERQLRLLDAAADRDIADPEDRAAAKEADEQGLGAA